VKTTAVRPLGSPPAAVREKEIVAAAAAAVPTTPTGGGGGFVNPGATVEIDLSTETPDEDKDNGKDRRSSGQSDA